jgi:hypothetical protein
MRFVWPLFVLLASSTGLLAQSRYEIVGETLVFNMTIEESGHKFTQQLERYDVNLLSDYLFEHPEIKILKLTGPGGFMPAAREMASKIIEFDLNTVAYGECESACTTIFLAGNKRSLETGATLGFHRQWVDKEQEKLYYNAMKETKGWKNEFDYIAWIYNVLADNIVKDIEFMERRGVSMDFILKALSIASYDMWEPSREDLLEAGVLTE